ncbi:MAG: sporulation membrane protein YtaF [Desulfotomaculaceae bacterium]|nr:sporulation membrane protein YtaF [Desulfotomaculaceae bacterium]
MELLLISLLIFSISLDSFGIGIVYGLRNIKLPLFSNLLIALMTGLCTLLAMKTGIYFIGLLPPSWSNYISPAVLIAVGIWTMTQSWAKPGNNTSTGMRNRAINKPPNNGNKTPKTYLTLRIKSLGLLVQILREPSSIDWDYSGTIDLREACLLGAALSLNNLAGGVAGGMAGLKPELTAIFTTLISILFFLGGNWLGRNYLSRWTGEKAAYIAGSMLIIIGIIETCL